jgi:hypothetical protein
LIAWVIKNGVPFDVAYSLDEEELWAYSIVFAQFENGGKEFDWSSMRFLTK